MGIYVMVSVDLQCDNCGKPCGKLYTAKNDLPFYADAVITCEPCIDRGFVPLKGSNTQEIVDFVNQLNKERP